MQKSIIASLLRQAAEKLDSGNCTEQDMEVFRDALNTFVNEPKESHATILKISKK